MYRNAYYLHYKKIGSILNAWFNVMVIISYSFRHVMEHQGAIIYVFVKTVWWLGKLNVLLNEKRKCDEIF